MNDTSQFEGVFEGLEQALGSNGFRYAIIGGAAVVVRGYDRATVDVDALVLESGEQLSQLVECLRSAGFRFRIDDGVEFARHSRVLLLKAADGTSVDLSMGYLPFEAEVVTRASKEDIGGGVLLPFATAEDLVIMKLVAMRDRDRVDVQRLVELYPEIDRKRIRRTVEQFAEVMDRPEMVTEMEKMGLG